MPRNMFAVERRWRKEPPAPYTNEWDAVWVNFNNKADAETCMAEEAENHAFEYRVVEQERVYGIAA